MLRKLFGPKNSLVIPFDGKASLDRDELDARLDHVEAYYKFAPLSELVDGLAANSFGLASLVFLSPRKRTFLEILPELESRRLPVTILADTDTVGSNRLTADEEIQAYLTHYPPAAADRELIQLVTRWREGTFRETELLLARVRHFGPFPVEHASPFEFCVTWGKITEVPVSLREVGITFSRYIDDKELEERLQFVAQRAGSAVRFAAGATFLSSVEALPRNGIRGVVGEKTGVVEKGTSPFDLPRFAFEAV